MIVTNIAVPKRDCADIDQWLRAIEEFLAYFGGLTPKAMVELFEPTMHDGDKHFEGKSLKRSFDAYMSRVLRGVPFESNVSSGNFPEMFVHVTVGSQQTKVTLVTEIPLSLARYLGVDGQYRKHPKPAVRLTDDQALILQAIWLAQGKDPEAIPPFAFDLLLQHSLVGRTLQDVLGPATDMLHAAGLYVDGVLGAADKAQSIQAPGTFSE